MRHAILCTANSARYRNGSQTRDLRRAWPGAKKQAELRVGKKRDKMHVTCGKYRLSRNHARLLRSHFETLRRILCVEISRKRLAGKNPRAVVFPNRWQTNDISRTSIFARRDLETLPGATSRWESSTGNGESSGRTSRGVRLWIWIKSRGISRLKVSWSLLCSSKPMSVSSSFLDPFFFIEMKVIANRINRPDEHNGT